MPAATLVIVNPRTRARGRRWQQLEARIREQLGAIEVEQTRGPRDAERIAREAVRSGVERLIVAGGDGTVSEVVTGLLAADLGRYAELAILPLGSGCDFSRSVGLPRRPEEGVALLRDGTRRRVDAGRVSYEGRDGARRVACFLNILSFGLSGLTDELVNRAGKRLGPSASFALGTIGAILSYRAPDVVIRVDGRVVHTGAISLATAANGRYFGGGMLVAPEALVDDGALDVVVVSHLSKPALVAKFPMIYRGAHLADPAVSVSRGVRVEAEVLRGEALLDVDGEPLGRLPASIEVLPKAIALFGLPLQAKTPGAAAAG